LVGGKFDPARPWIAQAKAWAETGARAGNRQEQDSEANEQQSRPEFRHGIPTHLEAAPSGLVAFFVQTPDTPISPQHFLSEARCRFCDRLKFGCPVRSHLYQDRSRAWRTASVGLERED
jgi:hypothetical protein